MEDNKHKYNEKIKGIIFVGAKSLNGGSSQRKDLSELKKRGLKIGLISEINGDWQEIFNSASRAEYIEVYNFKRDLGSTQYIPEINRTINQLELTPSEILIVDTDIERGINIHQGIGSRVALNRVNGYDLSNYKGGIVKIDSPRDLTKHLL